MTVEGVNIRSKHMKPMKEGEAGQLLKLLKGSKR